MSNAIQNIDRIPAAVVIFAGIVGFLVLVRYVHIRMVDTP